MKLCDIVIAVLLGIIVVMAIIYQFDNTQTMAMKNCVRTTLTEQQLAECLRNVKK